MSEKYQARNSLKMTLEQEILEKYNNDISKIIEVLKQNKSIRNDKTKPTNVDSKIVVDIQNMSKTYKIGKQKIEALNNINLQIRQGEYVALTGSSGSGKSTLLQLMGALDKPTSGSVLVDGQNITKLTDRKLSIFRNRTIGFVFQFFYLQPFLSLERNLEVPGMFMRTKSRFRKAEVYKLAEQVSLTDRLKHLPNELSGGQMQRAAIARALLNNPKIILADEPTGNLDRSNAYAIMDLFDAVRENFGTTVVVVTHDEGLANRTDRELSLSDGKLIS